MQRQNSSISHYWSYAWRQRLSKTNFPILAHYSFWKTNLSTFYFSTYNQHLRFRAWRVMRLLFGFKRTEAQHAIKRDKRDSRHGAHNLIPHCSTMRRRMYGGGSSGDDEGAPPSPPLGMALADATADMWQRTRAGGRGRNRRCRWGGEPEVATTLM